MAEYLNITRYQSEAKAATDKNKKDYSITFVVVPPNLSPLHINSNSRINNLELPATTRSLVTERNWDLALSGDAPHLQRRNVEEPTGKQVVDALLSVRKRGSMFTSSPARPQEVSNEHQTNETSQEPSGHIRKL